MSNLLCILSGKESFKSFGEADKKSVLSAEQKLLLRFSNEYVDYLSAFLFVIYDGHELTGLCKAKRLNVVDVTLAEREVNPNVPKDWYVIEQTHIDDIVIWQNAKGEIYQTAPNAKPIKICDSLAEYVERY